MGATVKFDIILYKSSLSKNVSPSCIGLYMDRKLTENYISLWHCGLEEPFQKWQHEYELVSFPLYAY